MPRRLDYTHDPSTRPRVRAEPGPRFPFPLPNGWFIVAASDELAPGDVVPLHYFGRDLVVFRTEAGEARLTDAYCAHLGAHLGVGGRVEGECLVCPFHGWEYEGSSGRCVKITYGSGRIPSQAKIRTFPTLERNGMVWAWFHLAGGPPSYEVPVVSEIGDPEWSAPHVESFTVRTACQEMAENNHDAAHFRYVHGTDSVPEDDVLIDGTYKRVVAMDGQFVRESFGLGLGVLHMGSDIAFLSSTTPVDEDTVHVRWIFVTPRSAGPGAAAEAAASFTSGLSQDIPIWENKRYNARPVLLRDERSILDHRKWCEQFYSDPASALD
jgi:phenylpropionate dioxygenase-like ring-hydroxylating dioxygenase large terminal subunit